MNISRKKRVRINLEYDAEVREAMDLLQVKSGAASISEVIRRSLALYDLVVDHTKEGGKLVLRFRNGEEEQLRLL